MSIEKSNFHSDDEVALIDILLVVWKNRLFALSILGLFFFTALAYLILSENIYRVYMSIQPSSLEINGEQYVDTPQNIKQLVDSNILTDQVAKTLKKESPGIVSFSSVLRGPTSQIIISTEHASPEIGVQSLNSLISELNKYYLPEIEERIETLKANDEDVALKISLLTQEYNKLIANRTDKLAEFSNGLLFYTEKLKNIRESMKMAMANLDILKPAVKYEDDYNKWLTHQPEKVRSSIQDKHQSCQSLYGIGWNKIISSMSSSHRLVHDIEVYKAKLTEQKIDAEFFMRKIEAERQKFEKQFVLNQESMEMKKEQFEIKKGKIQEQIKKMGVIRDSNKALSIVNPPRATANPIRPNKKNVLIAGLGLGLICALLFTFLKEYLVNQKNLRE